METPKEKHLRELEEINEKYKRKQMRLKNGFKLFLLIMIAFALFLIFITLN